MNSILITKTFSYKATPLLCICENYNQQKLFYLTIKTFF